MRRRVVVVLVLVTALWLASYGGVLADGMILPGVFSPDYLAVRSHQVSVRIEDGHAITRVVQEFHNPHQARVDGRYLFPIPPGAILSRFEAEMEGWQPEVIRQNGAETNHMLYEVLAQRRDPSLLRYVDWDSLTFDITLPPGGARRMTLEYEEVLAPVGGLYSYRYVLSTERYTSQPLSDVSVTVDVVSSRGLSTLYSSTHAVDTERTGTGMARIHWQERDVVPTEDFELFYGTADAGFGAGFLTGRRNEDDHFLFLFSPEVELEPEDVLPKDIVLVLDRSGSMDGEKLAQAQRGLRFILDQLGDGDRFGIVTFNDQLSTFRRELLPATDGNLQDAHRYVDFLRADGWTDLEAALQAGLAVLGRSSDRGATQMVVFLTDGLPTAGVADEALIATLFSRANTELEARLHVFGVGYDVNTHLLDRLAADNSGTVTYVQPGEDLEAALTRFYGRIAHPLLTDVNVQFDGIQTLDLYPQAIPDLFAGSNLLLTGRYQANTGSVKVRVSGWAGERKWEAIYTFDLDEVGGKDFVPRLWATRRVGELLDRVRVDGESAALVREVRELGIAYGLVTPYTTFVIHSQADGAASTENMALYGDTTLNDAWGEVTVQARVQNQAYQQASQADLALGANVINAGQRSLAQVGQQNLDLSLLQGANIPDGLVDTQELVESLRVDRRVQFGSDEYFRLAADPEARLFLQNGTNVLFGYRGQVIEVRDADQEEAVQALTDSPGQATGVTYLQSQQLDPVARQVVNSIIAWLALLTR